MRIRLAAAALLVLAGGCGRGSDHVAATSTTTTEPTTATTVEVTTTTIPTTTTKVTAPIEVKDRKCAVAPSQGVQPRSDNWATYWQTEPDSNQPLTLEICIDDATPLVGQLVTLTVTADDPDASIGEGDCDIYVTWMSNPGNLCRDTVVEGQPPEPTPAKEHGHRVKTYTHTYTKAQTYLVDVTVWSSPESPKRHPYRNSASAELHLSVHV